jgi:hypothetical protein
VWPFRRDQAPTKTTEEPFIRANQPAIGGPAGDPDGMDGMDGNAPTSAAVPAVVRGGLAAIGGDRS